MSFSDIEQALKKSAAALHGAEVPFPLVDAGLRADDPPEEWLVKAWDGDTLVDLIFYPKGTRVDDDLIERGEVMSVLGMEMRVMALEDVLVTNWADVRTRTADSPWARAFFVMLEGLGVLPETRQTTGGHEPRVRVLSPRGSAATNVG